MRHLEFVTPMCAWLAIVAAACAIVPDLPAQERAATGAQGSPAPAQTWTAPLLVDLDESGQGLRVRPVHPETLADLPGHAPLDLGHHYAHAVSPDGGTLAVIIWPDS